MAEQAEFGRHRESVGTEHDANRAISRIHQALAAMEIAFCTVLLVSAILLAQSLVRVMRANAWGNVSHVLTLGFSAPPQPLPGRLAASATHYKGD